MPSGFIPYRRQRGPQIPGIWSTHKLLTKEYKHVREELEPLWPLTAPMIIAYKWLKNNNPDNDSLDLDKLYKHSPEIYAGVIALMAPRPKMTTASNDDIEALLDPSTVGTSSEVAAKLSLAVDIFHPVITSDPKYARMLEHILLDGSMLWQVYAVLFDTVKETPYSHYGGFKPWVVKSLESYGFGRFETKNSQLVRGRQPKLFIPNKWGVRFVTLVQQNSVVEVNDDMRAQARILGKLPNPYIKFKELKRRIDFYESEGIPTPQNVIDRYEQLRILLEED